MALGRNLQARSRRLIFVSRWAVVVAAALTASCLASSVSAQAGVGPVGALRVYLECPACDGAHIRRELAYVDWVRDRTDSDVHILGTHQAAGAGGVRYELTLTGHRRFAGQVDTVHVFSGPDETTDTRRERLVHAIQLGLVRYLATTPLAPRLRVTVVPATPGDEPVVARHDPWDAWVFSTSLNAMLSGEQQQGSLSLSTSVGANRTTEASKLIVGLTGSYFRNQFTFQVPDAEGVLRDTTIVSDQRNADGSLLAVWSAAGQWSAGVKVTGGSNSFLNRAWAVEGGPAIEYSVFPYAESTRRQMTVRYTLAGYAVQYEEATLFDRTRETRGRHTLDVAVQFLQPWGSASAQVTGSQFLHEASLHSVNVGGSVGLRLVRGLSLSMSGNVARIKDQIHLRKGNLPPEEVLLQRRQLGTDYRYFTTMGFSYTFGSPFSAVVNTRMAR